MLDRSCQRGPGDPAGTPEAWRRFGALGFDLLYTIPIRSFALASFLAMVAAPLAVVLGVRPGDLPEPVGLSLGFGLLVSGFLLRDYYPPHPMRPRARAAMLNGKRAFRLQVINSQTGSPASAIESIQRNLALLVPPLWPSAVLGILQGKEMRCGDRLASTRVIREEGSRSWFAI